MKILFWNIQSNNVAFNQAFIYAKKHDVDILIFCECPIFVPTYQGYTLNRQNMAKTSIAIYSSNHNSFSTIPDKNPHYGTFVYGKNKLNIIVVHMSCQIYEKNQIYRLDQTNLIKCAINDCEEKYSKATLIIGDFNTNVFDPILYNEAEICLTHFKNDIRTNNCVEFDFGWKELFYSPCLNQYKDNDRKNKPNGTCFCDSTFNSWQFFDYAIMNQNAFKKYKANSFKIIDRLGNIHLVKNHKIDTTFSDHLPIMLELKGA